MQAAPTLFTQNKKPMGFYLPASDSKGELVGRIEEHGGKVNVKWNKDLIVLVPPAYYGKAPAGAEVYSYDYVLASIRKNQLQPLESYRIQVPHSPTPAAKTKTSATAPAPATAATPKTTTAAASSPAAKAYTKEEDETIKSYVSMLGLAFSPTGTMIWMQMEKSKVVPGRTWQSLKDRYLKRILPVEEALGSLSSATSTSASTSSSTSVASKASPARPSTSGSRRVSVAHDSSTPVRKQLFGKANTLDGSGDEREDEEGEEKEAEEADEENGEDEDEGEGEDEEEAEEEVSDGLKKSPKQQKPSAKSGTVTSTPTTTTKRKASEPPSSAVAKEKTVSPAPKDKRRKIEDDSEEEEEVENGKAHDSEAEEVEVGLVSKPSGEERTDQACMPGGRAQEVEHVVARLQEETGQDESIVFHALAVASGDPALALLYLRGRQMWYEPWTPAEDKELRRSGAGGRVAARAKADVHARCAFLGVH